VLELLASARVSPADVDAIGSHGQTVRHVPRRTGGGHALSLQIGSADVLAERTGIVVVSDFRRRDTAAGGEGAPLVPLVDWGLFRDATESRVLLNVGGMANLTYLPKGGALDRVLAFDTGPGNAVIDGLVRGHTGGLEHMDHGGTAASRGRANEALLSELLADPFFALPPPRSTGREEFGESYARRLAETGGRFGLGYEDLLATAVELTARSVGLAVDRFVRERGAVDAAYVSGGGAANPTLRRALERSLAPVPVRSIEALGIPPEAKEAVAFAYLAHRTLEGSFGNVPSVTGAGRPVVLGHIVAGA
jgi:anhydro-N-acetylmuramic acid kinase